MSSRHYHTPPAPSSPRNLCPVCRKSVYSRAGIHPQCAVKLPDPPGPETETAAIHAASERAKPV